MPLTFNRYGKARVRVLRLQREGERHTVRELSVQAMLEAEGLERAYTAGDNAAVVATDTIKNVVNALACDHPAADGETFAGIVAAFLLDRYAHVGRADIRAVETRWTRLVVDGAPHPHAFALDGNGTPFAHVVATRDGTVVQSGIEGYTVMKTTQAGWSGFHADAYRTLPDTDDRIVATAMDATWTWTAAPAAYPAANATILDAMLRDFATTYSRGVQDSMYRMGEAALAAVPELAAIRFAMPNKHYLPMNLAGFGRDAAGTVFLPTDEPHGQIEAVVTRA